MSSHDFRDPRRVAFNKVRLIGFINDEHLKISDLATIIESNIKNLNTIRKFLSNAILHKCKHHNDADCLSSDNEAEESQSSLDSSTSDNTNNNKLAIEKNCSDYAESSVFNRIQRNMRRKYRLKRENAVGLSNIEIENIVNQLNKYFIENNIDNPNVINTNINGSNKNSIVKVLTHTDLLINNIFIYLSFQDLYENVSLVNRQWLLLYHNECIFHTFNFYTFFQTLSKDRLAVNLINNDIYNNHYNFWNLTHLLQKKCNKIVFEWDIHDCYFNNESKFGEFVQFINNLRSDECNIQVNIPNLKTLMIDGELNEQTIDNCPQFNIFGIINSDSLKLIEKAIICQDYRFLFKRFLLDNYQFYNSDGWVYKSIQHIFNQNLKCIDFNEMNGTNNGINCSLFIDLNFDTEYFDAYINHKTNGKHTSFDSFLMANDTILTKNNNTNDSYFNRNNFILNNCPNLEMISIKNCSFEFYSSECYLKDIYFTIIDATISIDRNQNGIIFNLNSLECTLAIFGGTDIDVSYMHLIKMISCCNIKSYDFFINDNKNEMIELTCNLKELKLCIDDKRSEESIEELLDISFNVFNKCWLNNHNIKQIKFANLKCFIVGDIRFSVYEGLGDNKAPNLLNKMLTLVNNACDCVNSLFYIKFDYISFNFKSQAVIKRLKVNIKEIVKCMMKLCDHSQCIVKDITFWADNKQEKATIIQSLENDTQKFFNRQNVEFDDMGH